MDLVIRPREVVAVLGSNGAGKSTLNNTVCGLFPAFAGSVRFAGRDITRAGTAEIVAAGLIQVPEGRRVFPNLSVLENLELGSYRARARAPRDDARACLCGLSAPRGAAAAVARERCPAASSRCWRSAAG